MSETKRDAADAFETYVSAAVTPLPKAPAAPTSKSGYVGPALGPLPGRNGFSGVHSRETYTLQAFAAQSGKV